MSASLVATRSGRRLLGVVMGAGVLVGGVACDESGEVAPPDPGGVRPTAVDPPDFVDVAAAAGIAFRHERGARGERRLHETMGGGLAWLDYDRDGDPDLYVTSGQPALADGSFPSAGRNRLLRNDGGRFVDVTGDARVAGHGYALGAAVGDIDDDGFPDLYVTCFGPNVLYRNRGDGSFEELDGPPVRIAEPFSAGCVFADFDLDGLPDLYVASYVALDDAVVANCTETTPGGTRVPVYCGPIVYRGAADHLFRNLGAGRFEDVTRAAGIGVGRDAPSKSLGVLATDLDRDGDVDIFVACDTTANLLYRNRGDGSFDEVGLVAGVAASDAGVYEGGMGIAIGDVSRDGLPDLLVTNFAEEPNRLWVSTSGGGYVDATDRSGIGRGSRALVGWGAVFVDTGGEGSEELLVANGHIHPNVADWLPEREYEQRSLLYRARDGRFEEIGATLGPDLVRPRAHRGVAAADFDGDGRVDIALGVLDGPLVLLRGNSARHHWLAVRVEGAGPGGRDAIGARVEVRTRSGTQVRWRSAGGSYLSEHAPELRFGLGADDRVDELRVEWPGGGVSVLEDLDVDRTVAVRRGR